MQQILECVPNISEGRDQSIIDAVNSAPELDIHLPETEEQWQRIKHGFTNKSSDGIISGCVGALDGFFHVQIGHLNKVLLMCYHITLAIMNRMV